MVKERDSRRYGVRSVEVAGPPPVERPAFGPPPLPREHGAWAMLYLPLVLGVIVAWPVPLVPGSLLVASTTAAYLAQHAAGVLLRRRGAPGTGVWLALYGAVAVLSGAALILGFGLRDLLWLALPSLVLLGWYARHRRNTRRQIDRSLRSQLASVAVLALTAPAAVIVARGQLTPGAAAACL